MYRVVVSALTRFARSGVGLALLDRQLTVFDELESDDDVNVEFNLD